MNVIRMSTAILAALVLANSARSDDQFDLGAMGGSAVSPDNKTLVVSLTAKAELVYIDTLAGKELKRVKVEFQPTELVSGDKVIFAAQKNSGLVHILDADSGKELAMGKTGNSVRNLVVAKGVCFASTDNREVYAIDAKGNSTKAEAQGTFIAADPKGAFVCTVIDGKARTDITKYTVDGTKLSKAATLEGKTGASLQNVRGVRVGQDGKLVGVVAGGGWSDVDRKRHYGVPMYDAVDMKTQNGDLDTGAFPSGCTFHPVLPLVFACNDKQGAIFSAKSFAAGQKVTAPTNGSTTVLAFVAQGRKLAWGSSDKDRGVLKFTNVELTKEQEDELAKGFPGK
jgi:PQQ-like domain